ncbi:RNA ligase (ATP), putative [Acanthamoeba castellanii str. Neff]|uniref:RNA ligase (ATP), putative n=1 Tax=Acanthamoeba castellanii (strain ATCC 30010 / Neff) TaxID=1257118 RepID=L8HH23_ACACF|nr:RNA ligase (ATP), putative [Acanthamoeba castellanii str. Neff]ELR24512.1 RNA ligase (ATP), putative [Acanthamoeba castellanii str. Neff]
MESTGTTELHTVRFLRREGLEALTQKFGLLNSCHGAHPNLVLFKYDQVDSPFDAVEVQECRGLIVDKDDDWRPVAMPFLKFFNYGESNGADVDWSKPVRVMDKVDGSLSTLYYYKGDWHVSSSGRPDGGGSDPNRKLFRDLFWQTWKAMNYTLPDEEHQHYCFMFELFSAENRIIVSPQEELLLLTGARNMQTLQEVDPAIFAERYGWRMPQLFEFKSLAEVTEAAKGINPHFREGFVVCDHRFNRLKIKSPLYVALAHLTRKDKSALNKRRMLDIVRHNEGGEFLTYFPQWTSLYNQVKERFDELCNQAESAWEELKGIGNERDFANACRTRNVADYLFARKKDRVGSARAFYGGMPEKKLEQILPRWKALVDTTPSLTPLVVEAQTDDEEASTATTELPDEEERNVV